MTTELAASAYPVDLGLSRPVASARFWAIPLIGIFVKGIILIPHLIIIYVLTYVVGLVQLVIWIPVLFGGRYPDWAFGLVAGYLRWAIRISLYFYGVTDAYPAFGMNAPGDVVIAHPAVSSRFFAIPIIGAFVRWALLIPHFIILYALSIAVGACQLVIWIPVLFTGQYPGWAFTLVAGTVLWATRVYAYLLGLTDTYPPFSFT
jgi:Domain of unknown function (DUF4389)